VATRFILVVLAVAIFHLIMLPLITILNRCHRFPGFVYQQARFSLDHRSIEIAVRPRQGSQAICSRCHQAAPGYDQLVERRFEFIPFWGFLVFLLYAMRRVDCSRCDAVVVEEIPWGDGKRTLTKAYMLFLARWARRLSWKETAEAFRTSWDKVFDAVEHVVTFGLEHRTLGQIDAIGVDEIQYSKGHKYLTLVYQIDIGVTRLLWVGKERTIESFQGFFTMIGEEIASKIVFVCSDMWEPYLKVIREKCSEALHILDRFHIVAKMNTGHLENYDGDNSRVNFYDLPNDKGISSYNQPLNDTLWRNKDPVQLVHDGGFADAGITGYEHELRRAVRHDTVEGREQRVDLALPPVQLLRDQQPV
jgi:hypothetical protein